MKVTQKKLNDGKIALDATASTAEVSAAFNQAHLMFAQQMGLSPDQGETVAQAAERLMGVKDLDAVVQGQAVEYLVPFAIDKTGVMPAFPPKPRPQTALRRGQTFRFELTLTPKPSYELSSYDPVEIEIAPMVVSDNEVDVQMADIARRYATYVVDDPHPVRKGDSCLLALESFEDGERLPGLTAEARTYTTGAGLMPDGFDENIVGMDVGETKTFTFEIPAADGGGAAAITSTATVKEIQKEVVPVLDDEWVKENLPMYRDAAAMRASVRESLVAQRGAEYEDYKRNMAVEELARRFSGRIPDEVYESMARNLLGNFRQQAAQQGMRFEDLVQQQGGEQQFNMMVMMQARQMLMQGYALDALFDHHGLVVEDGDVDEACRSMNPQNPQAVRTQMEQTGRGFALREAAERTRATRWLVEHAKITVREAPVDEARQPEE